MSLISDKFKQVAEDQKIQFKAKEVSKPIKDREGNEVERKQTVFQSGLMVNKNKPVPCAVIVEESAAERVNYQITYNRIGYVSDRNKLDNILFELNELNRVKTGYYHFIVTDDGEIQLRHLGITGEDVRPMLNIFVNGGRIIRALLPTLEEIVGIDLTPRKD